MAELTRRMGGDRMTKYVSAYVPDDVKDWVRAEAGRRDVTESDLIRWLVESERERQQAAVAEDKAGTVVATRRSRRDLVAEQPAVG